MKLFGHREQEHPVEDATIRAAASGASEPTIASELYQRDIKKSARRKHLYRITTVLGCLVVFITTYALILPALTQDETAYCGHVEHSHSEECYTQTLICEIPEEGHVHTDECYTVTLTQACGLEEHVHDDTCYTTTETLTCELEEHVHDETCYDEEGNLVCELEEHIHDDSCYTEETELTCELEEHTHSDACMVEERTLICELEEREPHVHTDECYSKELSCGMEEHTHSLICFSNPNADTSDAAHIQAANRALEAMPADRQDVWGEAMVAIAESQEGFGESDSNYAVTESGNKKGYTIYGARYGMPYEDWCAMFVMWCMNRAGVENVPTSAGCTTWIRLLSEADLYCDADYVPEYYVPRPGDLVFFDWVESNGARDGMSEHVGILKEARLDSNGRLEKIITIEGNTSGGIVKENSYSGSSLHDIMGYGVLPLNPNHVEPEPETTPEPTAAPSEQEEPATETVTRELDETSVEQSEEATESSAETLAPNPESEEPAVSEVPVEPEQEEPETQEEIQPEAEPLLPPEAEEIPAADPVPDVEEPQEPMITPEPIDPEIQAAMEAAQKAEEKSFLEKLFGFGGEEAEPVEEDMPAQTFQIDGDVSVSVSAGEGALPRGSKMVVQTVKPKKIMDSVTDVVDGEILEIQAVDITFFNARGKEIEPAKEISVTIGTSLPSEEAVPVVVHVDDDGNANLVQDVVEDAAGDAVTFDADTFSVYAVVYTVDFEYEWNGQMYRFSLSGGEKITLSELVEVLGLTSGTNYETTEGFIAAVENVEFSNQSLVKVEKIKDDWVLESLKAFTSEEALLITMKDGTQFVIKVTDAQYTNDLNSLLTDISVTVNGQELQNGQTVNSGDKFNLHLEISENDFFQFPDDTTEMVYQLPAGITLDSATTYITINMGIDGKVYRNKLVYDPATNTLRLTWNTKDPNFTKLISNDNTKIVLNLSGSFNENATHVDFSTDLGVDVVPEEHHDADINKTGQLYLPGANGNPYDQPAIKYTVTVTSDGATTVNVNDVVEGSAVTLDTTNWTATSNKGTTITPTFTNKDFSLNDQSLQDGEVVTITYWGKVDTSKINNVTNVSYSETGNKVTLTGDDFPDKEATHYEHQVGTRNVSKYSTGVVGSGQNEQTASWTIKVNENPTASIGGSTITDSIAESSRSVMSYDTSTKPYLTVRDASGNIVTNRSGELEWSALGVTNASTQKTWTYNIPQNDGAYSYEITYKTIVNTSSMTGPTSVSNNVDTQNGSSTGTANVGPKPEDQKYTITKNKVSVDEEKTTWSITVTADPGQYDSFVITDVFPTKDYYGRFFVDGYEIDSARIVGLEGDEWVDIVTYQDYLTKQEAIRAGDNEQINKVEFVFYQDGKDINDKSHPGLNATSQRTFTIELTSINSKAWIKEAQKGEDEGTLSHTNTALVNNVRSTKSAEPMSKTVFKYRKQGAPQKPVLGPDEYTDASRSGGVSYPMYAFRVIAGGVDEDTVVIEDYFNTDLFKVYVPNPMDRNKAPQFWGGNGDPKYAHNEEIANYDDLTFVESDGKVTFTATNIPKDDSAYYSFYMVEYNLIPKSEEAWNTIKQMALENGGEYIFSNTAKYDDSESEIDFKYNYNVIDKSSVAESDDTLTLLKYTIKINPDKLTLNNGEAMTMTDTYTSNLSVDFGSITVTAVDKGGNDRSSEVTWDYRGNVGTFTIPDETYVVLQYSARAVGDPGSVQTVSNTAYMEGYYDTETKDQIVDISGGGTSERVRIRLLKFAADHMEGGLDGAVFRLLDQDKNPVIDMNGNEVTYTTGTGYLNKYGVIHAADDKLDYVDRGTGDTASYDTGVNVSDLNESGRARWQAGTIANPTSDADKIVTYADLSPAGMARLGVTLHGGFAEVYMNQNTQGAALKKERVYYLEEIKTPVGPDGQHYEKTNVKYSFLISDQSDYSAPGGVYVYHNNDVMTVRNWPTEEATLQISKTFIGNVELTDAQKNKVTFTIKKKNSEGVFEDFPISVYNAETGKIEQKATFTYGDKKDADGTPLFVDGVLTIENIEAGEYQVVESNTEITDTTETIKYRTEYLVDGDKQTPTDSGVTVTITEDDIQNNASHDVAVTNSYFTNKYELQKYAADTAQAISGAKFKIVKIDPTTGAETTVKENLETDSDGKLDIRFTSNSWGSTFQFDTQALYYVVETAAPTGFVLPAEPEKYYFYFSANPATEQPSDWTPGQKSTENPGGLPSGETAVDLAKSYGSAAIPNRRDTTKTYVSVNKKWVNSLGRDITGTMTDAETVSVKLYRTTQKLTEGTVVTNGDTENTNTASEIKTLTVKNGSNEVSKLYFLPGDKVQITAQGTGLTNASLNVDPYQAATALVNTDNRKSWSITMPTSDTTATISNATGATGVTATNVTSANRVYVLSKAQAENITKDDSFSQTATLNATGNWTHTFSDLDVTDTSTGLNYFYYLVEDDATTDTTYDVGSKSITVTNKAPEQLEVNKRWEDSNGNSINNEMTDGSITYELYQVENPLAVGPYTGTGDITADFSQFLKSTYNSPVAFSNVSGDTGNIKIGSKIQIVITTTDQHNSPLTGSVSVQGAELVSDSDGVKNYETIDHGSWSENKYINTTRTIIVSNVIDGFKLVGTIAASGSNPSVVVTVLEEPTNADTEWEALVKNKMGEIVVTHDNATLTKESAFEDSNFRVTPGAKAWSSLVYNLPSSGKKDGKTVNYSYYVVEKEVSGFTTTYQLDGSSVEYANGEPGDTIVIVNKELERPKGSLDFKALKTLIGGTLQADQFAFTLKEYTDNTFTTVKTNGESQTKRNAANGDVIFDTITLNSTDTRYFTIQETAGSDTSITYDSKAQRITVAVTDDGEGHLVATKTYDPATTNEGYDAEFTNTQLKEFTFYKQWLNNTTVLPWPEVNESKAGITVQIGRSANNNVDNTFTLTYTISGTDVANDAQIEPDETGVTDPKLKVTITDAATEGDPPTYKLSLEGLDATNSSGELYTYFVKETSWPQEYKLSLYQTDQVTEKPDGSAKDTGIIVNTVEDSYELPSTGGAGTWPYWLFGACLMLGASILLWRRRAGHAVAGRGGGSP